MLGGRAKKYGTELWGAKHFNQIGNIRCKTIQISLILRRSHKIGNQKSWPIPAPDSIHMSIRWRWRQISPKKHQKQKQDQISLWTAAGSLWWASEKNTSVLPYNQPNLHRYATRLALQTCKVQITALDNMDKKAWVSSFTLHTLSNKLGRYFCVVEKWHCGASDALTLSSGTFHIFNIIGHVSES